MTSIVTPAIAAAPSADANALAGLRPRLPVMLRPDKNLLVYYFLGSLLLGPGFLFALVPLYFRYHTLRYEFDEQGITARWGILFRKEVLLQYGRIQDIHLTSNLVERWLGLGKVQVQTASGSSSAELTVEGIPQFEAVRDFLYTRMRGARAPVEAGPAGRPDDLAAALRDVAGEVRALRLALAPHREGDA